MTNKMWRNLNTQVEAIADSQIFCAQILPKYNRVIPIKQD